MLYLCFKDGKKSVDIFMGYSLRENYPLLHSFNKRLTVLGRTWYTVLQIGLVSLLGLFPLVGQAYDLRDNAIAHVRAGQQLMDLERPAEAIDEFKAALQLNPYSGMAAAIYNNLGLAYRATGNYTYAYASFQRACRIQPTYAVAFANLIESYALAGRLPQAERYFLELVKENPNNAEAWFILGTIYKENKNFNAAKTCFERFLKMEPESDMAHAARSAL